MNEDEKFFSQFHEAPRPEFVAAVYKRINPSMNTQIKQITARQIALPIAMAFALLFAIVLINPPTRAQAYSWLRQIGVFTITTEQPDEQQPTALPPGPGEKPLTAASADAASELAGFQVLVPASLPDGYTAVGSLSILPTGNGKNVVASFADAVHGTFILINEYHPGDAFVDSVAGQETVQDVQVRGHEGVWITGRMMTSPIEAGQPDQSSLRPSNWLRWEENGIVYTVISDGLSLDATLQLAESLK